MTKETKINLTNDLVRPDILKQRAYNGRWAEVPEGVIPLTAADSDFPAAPEIAEAIIEYCTGGYFSYAPNRGIESFRNAVSKALKDRKNEEVDPEYILPLDSAARAMDVIAKAVLKPGDEAIVCDPVDFLFKTSMEAAGAKIVLFPTKIVDGKIDFRELEHYITPKTKMFGLCNPHNPLGMCYPIEDLDHILALSEKYNFYIMNDEIWSDMIYPDAKFTSILELGEERNKRTLSVYGFSKSFGIAGLRLGVAYTTNQEMYEKIVETSQVDSTIGGVSSLSQVAGQACLEQCFYWVDAFRQKMMENRDYALERICKMPGIKGYKPQATFVLYADISELGMPAKEFTDYVLENHKLSIVPGGERFFGPGSEGHIRICLATSHEILEEGLDRLEKALWELNNRV